MVVEHEDLGLTLGLSFSHNQQQQQQQKHSLGLNFMPSSSSMANLQKPSWIHSFNSSDRTTESCQAGNRSLTRGIDVNLLPSTTDCDEEVVLSSPNSTVSSISGKRSDGENIGDYNEVDEEDGESARKKLRLTKEQSATLEECFKEHNTLNPKQKLALAKQLGLRPRQVEVWFQNRRARTKLKQTEVDCEFLKRCCENLTEENRRLQKEVQELRALKLSPQFYMQMSPPTTLTMCPSCERIAAGPPAPGSDGRPRQMGPAQNRPVTVNPWGSSIQQMSLHPPS